MDLRPYNGFVEGHSWSSLDDDDSVKHSTCLVFIFCCLFLFPSFKRIQKSENIERYLCRHSAEFMCTKWHITLVMWVKFLSSKANITHSNITLKCWIYSRVVFLFFFPIKKKTDTKQRTTASISRPYHHNVVIYFLISSSGIRSSDAWNGWITWAWNFWLFSISLTSVPR